MNTTIGTPASPNSGASSTGSSSGRETVATIGCAGRPSADAPRALVVVEQRRVALGAQRAVPTSTASAARAQLAQQRAVGRVAERDRAPVDRGAPVGRGDHVGDDPRPRAGRPTGGASSPNAATTSRTARAPPSSSRRQRRAGGEDQSPTSSADVDLALGDRDVAGPVGRADPDRVRAGLARRCATPSPPA